MRYLIDHDYHIHSCLSTCSRDPEQTVQRILRYAQDDDLKQIVLTDHFWDEAVPGASKWYQKQNYDWITQCLPLPQAEGISFLFGAETDMDAALTIGVSDEHWDAFSFVVIPTTHLHFRGFAISQEDAGSVQGRADAWIRRLDSLLSRDLPFHKIGIAHLACGLIAPDRETYRNVLESLPDRKLEELFAGCAHAGVGIELNWSDLQFAPDEQEIVLRMFRIAKLMGCKFYLGSDAHQTHAFPRVKQTFERAVDLLELTEADKFRI